MAAKIVEASLLKAIKQYTTCDIGDALLKLNIPHGNYLSGLHMFSPAFRSGKSKICGPAHTVSMVHASDTTSPKPSRHFADTITKDSVVFISQPKGLISACWGGLMSTRAKKLGAAGVIIDGRFRDINEHQELGMGLFAREVSILGSNGFTRASEVNVPVKYSIEGLEGGGEVEIRPGDIVMGDADGVVVVPVEAVGKCLELCKERWEIDQKTMECLENGEEMGPTIKKLRK